MAAPNDRVSQVERETTVKQSPEDRVSKVLRESSILQAPKARVSEAVREVSLQQHPNNRVSSVTRETWLSALPLVISQVSRESWLPISLTVNDQISQVARETWFTVKVVCQANPYYFTLLASQYQNSENLLSWLCTILTPLSDTATFLSKMFLAFDIDLAVGPQLDILGVIVGVSRTVPFQPSGGVSPILDDPTYQILLKAKVGQNQWDGKIGSIYPLWQNLFPGGRISVQDNQNMTATITLSGAFTSIIEDIITNGLVIPRPEGVQYTFAFATLPIFGCDQDNAYVAGVDLGHIS